jgi:hypothetical protein
MVGHFIENLLKRSNAPQCPTLPPSLWGLILIGPLYIIYKINSFYKQTVEILFTFYFKN